MDTPSDNKHIVLYQGDCDFCNWCRRFVEARDHSSELTFVAIESDEGHRLIAAHDLSISHTKPDSIAYITPAGTVRYKWSACLEICTHLTRPMKFLERLLTYIVPTGMGNYIYDMVGEHRGLLCKLVRC